MKAHSIDAVELGVAAMNVMVLEKDDAGTQVNYASNCTVYEDPLDDDDPADETLTTSRRALVRLALVATEVGARFQREGVAYDPMAWMLSSRRLFSDRPALLACLELDECLRAVLLHGLSLGLDAAPAQIDALLCDTPGEPGGGFWEGGDGSGEPAPRPAGRQRLYSAMIVIARGGELIHLFHASVAPAASVVRERIRARFGAVAATQADIQLGVDLQCPTTSEILPPAFRMMVERGRRIRWSTMTGLDVTVEHRIPS